MSRGGDDKDGTVVYVGGLPDDIRKEELEVEFEKFGNLNRVWVAFNPPGFAFIEFENKQSAESAVDALHDSNLFGSKIRVEVSRGRGRGGRGGGGRGGDRGSFRGGRGGFRDREDFGGGRGGGRGGDISRGRGLSRGGRPTPYDRPSESFRGRDGGRFDDRRRPDFPERGYEDPRDFGRRRDLDNVGYGIGREFDFDMPPKSYGAGRDIERGLPSRDIERDYPPRDIPGRDFPPRDIPGRDFSSRDFPLSRDVPDRDFPPSRDVSSRDFPPRDLGDRGFAGGRVARDYGLERDLNGARGYGDLPVERGYGGGRDVDDFVPPRDVPIVRDYAMERDVGSRRDGPVRDFAPPRDLANPIGGLGGRAPRADFGNSDRFGSGPARGGYGDEGMISRASRFDGGRYSGGDIGGSGDYGGYDARDRFRSRSPISRGSRPIY